MYLRNKDFIINLTMVFGYGILSLIVFLVVRDGLHLMLAWNILLAFMPFLFVFVYDKLQSKNLFLNTFLLLLWLLFYPNAIYVITDFIYVDANSFIIPSLNGGFVYTMIIEQYVALFHIIIGAMISLYLGMLSLRVVYRYLKQSKYQRFRHWIIIGISLISGVAIYIGRFFRFNSWDIWRLIDIIKDFLNHFSYFTILFIMLISLIQLLLFYGFVNRKDVSII